jgi:DNA polymerase Ligase (LigD)
MNVKLNPDFAIGLPDKQNKETPIIHFPTEMRLAIQEHLAHKAGRHFDVRIVDDKTGKAYSWAVRSLPVNQGDRVLAKLQPTHRAEYSTFEGSIPEGYGAGTVKLFSNDRIEVIKAEPDKVEFNVYKSNADTERYAMIRSGGDDWLFTVFTPNKITRPEINISKPKYKSIDYDKINVNDPNQIFSPKVDGSLNVLLLRKGKNIETYSYRPSKRGKEKLIDHSFRTDLYKVKTPETMHGSTVLLGEIFAKDINTQKVLSNRNTSGILLSNVWRSRELQKEGPLDHMIFDVFKYQGHNTENLPYREKLEILKHIKSEIPELKLAPIVTSVNEKQLLIDTIRSGQHPLTQEGIIIRDLDKPGATKAKLFQDYDVRIRDIFPGEGKYKNNAAGGFTYSHVGDNTVVGRVGSGFSDEMRKQMYKNPKLFKGLVVRVVSQEKLPKTNALRVPVFKDIRSESWPR